MYVMHTIIAEEGGGECHPCATVWLAQDRRELVYSKLL